MRKWTEAVKTGRISVRQLVHITSPQDYSDLNDRIAQFKNKRNFTISAIAGLPIVPYGDIMILNGEYVLVGLSNDISSPNGESTISIIHHDKLEAYLHEKIKECKDFSSICNFDCCNHNDNSS